MKKVSKSDNFKCISMFYGLSVTADSQFYKEAEELSNKKGFTFSPIADYSSTFPTLIVKAGRDNLSAVLKSIDEFISLLMTKNVNFKLINFPEGRHAFDIIDDTGTSKEIILRTVEFFKKELIR